MRKLRWRITFLVGGSVLLMLLVVMAAFNIIIRRRMYRNADSALRSMLLPESLPAADISSPYSPEIIAIFDTEDSLYTQKESSVIEWCAGREPGTVQLAEADGNTYYLLDTGDTLPEQESLLLRPDGSSIFIGGIAVTEYVTEADEDIEYSETFGITSDDSKLLKLIGYIDITGELEMIRQIDLVFLISALLTGLLGGTAGYFTGRKLEQNELAQKQFFENTSHELKTPLTSIRGYAEGIETGVITDYRRTGRSIAAQTDKMSRLVEEILCMAKLESGSVTLEKEPIELSEFIQDCLMPFEGTVLTRGLTVELELEPMKVSADPDKLEHAVSNLLTNALKYARKKISVSCGNGSFSIANDCEQLPADTLAHLFERFYTGRDGNTGIGLCIAKDLIGLHGWKITAAPTGEGICFVIRCGK